MVFKFIRININMEKVGVSKKGFTLVEMLVAIMIVGVISSILVVNWRRNENRYQLQIVAQDIVQNIRKTQEMSLAGSKYFNSQSGTYQIAFNYGLNFNLSSPFSYKIFANKSNDRRYDPNDELLENVQIETGFEISSLTGSTGSLTVVDVTFTVPDGFTTIRKDQPTSGSPWQNSLTITIRQIGKNCPNACKNIIIRNTGEVSIQ